MFFLQNGVFQAIAGGNSRGKSGLRRTGCWVIPRKGNLTESATERKPPMVSFARHRQG